VGAGENGELGGGCHAARHRRPHPVCWFVACEEIGSVGQEGGRDAVWRGGQCAEMEGESEGGRRGGGWYGVMLGIFRVRSPGLYLSASRLECRADELKECWEVGGERWKQGQSQGGALEKESRATEFVRVYVDSYNAMLEEFVMRSPRQYLWAHDRWRVKR
jgi:hypothetical protein